MKVLALKLSVNIKIQKIQKNTKISKIPKIPKNIKNTNKYQSNDETSRLVQLDFLTANLTKCNPRHIPEFAHSVSYVFMPNSVF